MIEDHQLLAATPDVNYKELPAQPSPQDFLVLTRVRGTMTVAQLCNTSGLGREKTLEAIEVLLDVGLLSLIGADGAPIARAAATPLATGPSHDDAADPFEDALPVDEEEVVALGSAPSEPFVIERHPPATFAPDDFGIELPDEDDLKASDPGASSFGPVSVAVSDDEDDLFLASSPAHIARVEGRAPLLRGGVAAHEPKPEQVAPPKPTPPEPQKPSPQPEPPIDTQDQGDGEPGEAYRLFPIPYADYRSQHPPIDGIDAATQHDVDYVFDNLEYLDFYQLFGVDPSADRKALRTSYFVLSKRFHPDKYFTESAPALTERVATIFRYVTKGYETLSKPNKRREYDEALRQARDAAAATDAEEDRKRAMAADLLERRAGQLEQQGQFAQAAAELKKVGALRRDPQVLVRAASLYLRANVQLDEAAMLARAAIRDLPTEVEPRLVLGQIYEKNNMYDEALSVLTEAEGLAPDDPAVCVHLERIRARQ